MAVVNWITGKPSVGIKSVTFKQPGATYLTTQQLQRLRETGRTEPRRVGVSYLSEQEMQRLRETGRTEPTVSVSEQRAAEARAVQERAAEVARQEKQSVETKVSEVENIVVGLQKEASVIESQRTALEAKQVEIRRVEKSMVQRGTPYHKQLVSEYNKSVIEYRRKASDYNLRAQVTSLDVSAINREIKRVELGRAGIEFVKARVAEVGEEKVIVKVVPPVRERVGLERVELTPAAAREYVEKEVEVGTGLVGLREQLVAFKETGSPRALLKSLIGGQQVVQYGPVVTPYEAFTGAAGYGFGAAGKLAIPEELKLEYELPILGKRVVTKTGAVAGLEFAGKWAGFSTLFAAPKMIKEFPTPTVRLYKSRLEKLFAGKPKEVINTDLILGRDIVPRKEVELSTKVKELLFGGKQIAVKETKITSGAKEFLYGGEKVSTTTFRQFAPKELTSQLKKSLPELGSYIAPRGMQTQQIVKIKPKVSVEPGWYEGWPPAYFQEFEKVAKVVSISPSTGIPGSYTALARDLPRISILPVAKELLSPVRREPKTEFDKYVKELRTGVDTRFTKPQLSPVELEMQRTVFAGPKMESFISQKIVPTLGIAAGERELQRFKQLQREEERYRSAQMQQVSEAQLQKTIKGQMQQVSPLQIQEIAQVQLQQVSEAQLQKITQRQMQKVSEAQLQRMAQRQMQRMDIVYRRPPEPIFEEFKPKMPPPPILFPFARVFAKPKRKPLAAVPGFFPITRRAGEEIFLTKMPVSKEAARAIAIAEVVGSPRASFKILKAAAPAVKVAYPKLPFGVEKMFRPAKTLPGFFVEKLEYRIREPGELAGITAKGLAALSSPYARKHKKKKKKAKKK